MIAQVASKHLPDASSCRLRVAMDAGSNCTQVLVNEPQAKMLGRLAHLRNPNYNLPYVATDLF